MANGSRGVEQGNAGGGGEATENVGDGSHQDGSAARQTGSPEAARGGRGDLGLLISACLPQRGSSREPGTRSDPAQGSLAGPGARPQLPVGAVVADHRLASGKRSRGHAPLLHVPPKVGDRGKLQVYEDVPGLGRG